MDNFPCVFEAVRQSWMRVGSPEKVMAMLSGGADSVALLLALCTLREQEAVTVSAVHVNHGLRRAAAQDETFCRALCRRLDVALTVKRVSIETGGNLEAAARAARYAACRAAASASGAAVLAAAHHEQDQAETLLLHLLHGAGSVGLSGMREKSGDVWRPLLTVSRETLRDALLERGQDWREDESNAETAFTRNAIRAFVLPAMERITPKPAALLSRSASILQAESDFLEGLAEAFLQKNAARGGDRFLLRAPLAAQPAAMQRRILRRYALQSGLLLDFAQTERLRALLDMPQGAKANLADGWHAETSAERLHLLPPQRPVRNWRESVAERPFTGQTGDGHFEQAFPTALWRRATVRAGQSGDWIVPFGMEGRQKLTTFLASRGVDRALRTRWPVVCIGGEVLWAIGLGASQQLRISAETTDAVMIVFSGDLPDKI